MGRRHGSLGRTGGGIAVLSLSADLLFHGSIQISLVNDTSRKGSEDRKELSLR